MWILYVSFVGHAIQAVKNALNVELQDDPDLLSDVLSALSKRIQSGMNLYRSNILRKLVLSMIIIYWAILPLFWL